MRPRFAEGPASDPRDRGGPLQPLLIARDLRKHFPVKGSGGKSVKAVDGVSFTVRKGETLGIVGESGCGKSTLARLLLHLVVPDAGELVFDGDLVATRELPVDELRRQVQIVFQDFILLAQSAHAGAQFCGLRPVCAGEEKAAGAGYRDARCSPRWASIPTCSARAIRTSSREDKSNE